MTRYTNNFVSATPIPIFCNVISQRIQNFALLSLSLSLSCNFFVFTVFRLCAARQHMHHIQLRNSVHASRMHFEFRYVFHIWPQARSSSLNDTFAEKRQGFEIPHPKSKHFIERVHVNTSHRFINNINIRTQFISWAN